MDKLLQRIQKRGDEQGKTLTQKVLDNAKAADEKLTLLPLHSGPTKLPDGLDMKKEKHTDTKKNPSETPKISNGATVAKLTTTSGDLKTAPKALSTDAGNLKTKVVNVAAKPSGFFSSLKSASKRPGTSTKSEDNNSRLACLSGIFSGSGC